MKALLLLGGTGTRLGNLTKSGMVNKHLLPIGTKPMAQWNVEKLVNAGYDDILMVTGGEHIGGIAEYFEGGSRFGAKFTYKVQEEAGGIAQAIRLMEGFVDEGEFFLVILGDNIFDDDLSKAHGLVVGCLLYTSPSPRD